MAKSNTDRRLRFTIPPDQSGRALLDFLAARFPFFPPQGWIERIALERVVCNGRPCSPASILATGDLLEYLDWDIPEPPVSTDITFAYRDELMLAVNKPAGLPCHPGGRYFHNCLTTLLQTTHGISAPILVNRLDRETSGLVLVALDRRTARVLQQQFARRQVTKRYTAFVEGAFPALCIATGFILPDAGSVVHKRRRFISADAASPDIAAHPEADTAATRFTCTRTNGKLSEVAAWPSTGRLHQIRATLLALGFPIVGDKLYGPDANLFLRFCNGTLSADDHARLRLDRQALHAAGLRLRHPGTRRDLDITAPLPADLQTLAAELL